MCGPGGGDCAGREVGGGFKIFAGGGLIGGSRGGEGEVVVLVVTWPDSVASKHRLAPLYCATGHLGAEFSPQRLIQL